MEHPGTSLGKVGQDSSSGFGSLYLGVSRLLATPKVEALGKLVCQSFCQRPAGLSCPGFFFGPGPGHSVVPLPGFWQPIQCSLWYKLAVFCCLSTGRPHLSEGHRVPFIPGVLCRWIPS